MRVDLLLVQLKLAPTRTKAQEMIKSRQVFVFEREKKRPVEKPSEDFSADTSFEVIPGFATEFVSRAGHKIKRAVEELKIDIAGKTCLDIGVSTGGFSDFLLKSGAQLVIGVDVGQDQTDPLIRSHPRFTLFEKTNARALSENKSFMKSCPEVGFDFICMDVSFISIKLILPELWPLLSASGDLLILVKPQFELGPDALNENGIVKEPGLYKDLESTIKNFAHELKYKIKNYVSSSIDGKDGNKEFFLFLSKNSS